MYKFYLAFRYLICRPIALIAVGSVSLCIVLMVIITSLFNGFLDLFNDYWQYEYGQVSLVPYSQTIDHKQACLFLESKDEIEHVRLFIESGGLLFLSNGNVKQVAIKGIDLELECRADHFSSGLLSLDTSTSTEFRMNDNQTAAAESWLSRKLGTEISDSDRPVATPCIFSVGILGDIDDKTDSYNINEINDKVSKWSRPAFIFTGEVDSNSNNTKIKRKNLPCWPIDAAKVGSHHIDKSTVYLPFEYVLKEFNALPQMLIIGKDGISDLELSDIVEKYWREYIELKASNGIIDTRAKISITKDFPWLKMFTHEIQKQLATMKVILGFVCLVAAVLIFVIIMMIVLQKRRDIGIIRACGSTPITISWLFLYYGIVIGIVGTGLGLVLGYFAVTNIEILESGLSNILGFKIWKSANYGFSQIPNWIHTGSLWWICLSGVITAALGAFIPAFKASRSTPADSLRFE